MIGMSPRGEENIRWWKDAAWKASSGLGSGRLEDGHAWRNSERTVASHIGLRQSGAEAHACTVRSINVVTVVLMQLERPLLPK